MSEMLLAECTCIRTHHTGSNTQITHISVLQCIWNFHRIKASHVNGL